MNLRPIAILESCYKEKFGTPRQGVLAPDSRGILHMEREFSDFSFIQDLTLYSHLWLIGSFHLSTESQNAKVKAPRMQGSKLSVFATRSPHRPNPLSLSLVQLLEVENGLIHVAGVDLIDQTPIYDIKPYLPEYDNCPHASSKLDALNKSLPVQFSPEAEAALMEESLKFPDRKLRELITESLQNDPRPLAYLEKYPDRIYGVHLYNYNIRFQYRCGTIVVTDLEQID